MISKFSVRKPFTVLVGVILVIVLGVVSVMKMSTDLLPDINLPYVIIMTTYVGATPETVESVVTEPVESAMATISNVENITSQSAENYSVVILEFAQSADMDSVSLDIRESLDQLEAAWDDSVGSPIVMKLNPNMLPVMIAAVGAEGMDDAEVGEFVTENIVPEIESLEGVASVSTSGLIEESLHVVISEDKVNEVNERVAEYINEKFDEAYEELADSKEQIADGEAELAKAEKELNSNQKKLNDGKQELADGKTKLEETKDSTLDELGNAKLQLLTAKSDLEAAKTNISTNISTADGLYSGYTQLATVIPMLSTAAYTSDFGSVITAYQTAKTYYDADPTNTTAQATYETAKGYLDAYVASLTGSSKTDAGVIFTDDVRKAIKAIDYTDPTAYTQYSAIISAYSTALTNQQTSVGNQLTALTGGTDKASLDSYKATQNSALTSINSNMATVNANILKVYDGESDAVIQFANGLSQIDLSEYKLDVAQSQLDSGKETIESSKESLKEAKEQLAEGEESLEQSKEDALEAADLSGVLTVDTIKALLTAQNFSMPAGYVEEDGNSYMVRVGDKPESVADLKKLPLMKLPMSDNEIIYLEDVADVFSTDNSDTVYTNVNGERGVVLSITKATGYSTGDVSDDINDKFEELKDRYPDATIISLMDQGIYIDLVMNTIIQNVLVGGLLAIIVLMFFLRDFKPTLIIAISIPISLIFAIVCMYFSGVTLNIISLSGLALGVGMLVDNSIVVIENIYRMRNEGKGLTEAAIEGAKEVSGAIFASTLTTVCVFLPIVFTEGLTRQLFVDMGLTIAFSLMASLIVALTVVPALASVGLRKVKEQKDRKETGFYKLYAGFLRGCLKVKPLILIIALGLLGLSIALAYQNGTAYFPDMASTQVTVTVTPTEDSGLTDVKEETNTLVDRLMDMEDVVDVGAMASSSTLSLLSGYSSSDENVSSSTIYVTTTEDRSMSSDEITEAIENLASDIDGIEVSVETSTMDMSALGGSGITVNIIGRDLDTLYDLAGDVTEVLENTEGVGEVTSDIDEAGEELRIVVNKKKAARYGLTVAQVYAQIYPHLQDASVATTLSTNTDDISVYVEDGKDSDWTRQDIKDLKITYTNSDGEEAEVPLKDIAVFKDAEGFTTISREGQQRYVSVSATIADGYNVGLVSQDATDNMEAVSVPDGYTIEFDGENEMIMDALQQLGLMLVLAVIFIYLIMVAQFQSLSSPFIIMFTIPLAFTGGFLALAMTGYEISIVSVIGFVMLSGIIVNNGIVLVDYINIRRGQGLSKKEAIIDAGVTRLRPVLMTALTTILALLLMAFSTEMGADMTRPLAIVVIGGMVYGTLMTLIVVPCIYDMFSRDKKKPAVVPAIDVEAPEEASTEVVEVVEGVPFERGPEIVKPKTEASIKKPQPVAQAKKPETNGSPAKAPVTPDKAANKYMEIFSKQ